MCTNLDAYTHTNKPHTHTYTSREWRVRSGILHNTPVLVAEGLAVTNENDPPGRPRPGALDLESEESEKEEEQLGNKDRVLT